MKKASASAGKCKDLRQFFSNSITNSDSKIKSSTNNEVSIDKFFDKSDNKSLLDSDNLIFYQDKNIEDKNIDNQLDEISIVKYNKTG